MRFYTAQSIGSLMKGENLTKESLQEFIDLLGSGKIEIRIDKVFNFDEVPAAHECIESNQAKGKLVVIV